MLLLAAEQSIKNKIATVYNFGFFPKHFFFQIDFLFFNPLLILKKKKKKKFNCKC